MRTKDNAERPRNRRQRPPRDEPGLQAPRHVSLRANSIGDLDLSVPMVSLESVLDANPDLILIASPYEGFVTRWSDTWRRLNWQDRVRYVNASLVTRPSLRMLKGIKSMCKTMKGAD